MSDGAGQSVGKAIAALALFMVLINAIPAIAGSNGSWTTLQTAMKLPFPSFDNPFAPVETFTSELAPSRAYDTGFATVHGTDHGCAGATWWDCVNDPNGPDGNNTTVTQTFNTISGGALEVNLTGTYGRYLTGLIVDVACRTPSGNTPVPFNVYMDAVNDSYIGAYLVIAQSAGKADVCRNPSNNTPFPVTTVTPTIAGFCSTNGVWDTSTCTSDGPRESILFIQAAGDLPVGNYTAGSVVISTITVHASFSSALTSSCTGGDFFGSVGCQLNQIYQTGVKILMFGVNGVVFLGALGFYILNLIGAVLFGLVGSIAWILAIPAPYTPPLIVQMIIDVFVFGLLGSVLIVIISEIRGTGTVGV